MFALLPAGPGKSFLAAQIRKELEDDSWQAATINLSMSHTTEAVRQLLEACLVRWPGGGRGMPAGGKGLFAIDGFSVASEASDSQWNVLIKGGSRLICTYTDPLLNFSIRRGSEVRYVACMMWPDDVLDCVSSTQWLQLRIICSIVCSIICSVIR